MIKVVDSSSFDFGEPSSKLVDVHSKGVDKAWMTKRAAVLTKEIADIRPEKGHSYIHLISLGAGEYVGANRNGDFFNEKSAEFTFPEPKGEKTVKLAGGLMQYHPTFMKGHVFAHHNNDDPAKAIGKIAAAAYNPEMHRGELIIKVPHDKNWEKELTKLANGDPIAYSMAIKVPFDYCSICGNRARTRADYCDHLKDNMGSLTKEGHQVFAINDQGNFFDISKVFRPADRIAWSLQKVASATVQGGAELAEVYGLHDASRRPISVDMQKLAIVGKLAEIEKQIELKPDTLNDMSLCCPTGGVPDQAIDKLKQERPEHIRQALAEAKVILPLREFVKLTGGMDERAVGEADGMLPGMFSKALGNSDDLADEDAYPCSAGILPKGVRDIIQSMVPGLSIGAEPAAKRVRIMIIKSAGVPGKKEVVTSGSPMAVKVATEYAKYLVSFVKAAGIPESAMGLTIVRNYLRV